MSYLYSFSSVENNKKSIRSPLTSVLESLDIMLLSQLLHNEVRRLLLAELVIVLQLLGLSLRSFYGYDLNCSHRAILGLPLL